MLVRLDTITQLYTIYIVVSFPLTHKSNFAKLNIRKSKACSLSLF